MEDCLSFKSPTTGKRRRKPLIIAVAGGSAAGKKKVCELIMERIQSQNHLNAHTKVLMMSLDSFYRKFTPEEQELARQSKFNFDHPDAFDWKLLDQTLHKLRQGHPVVIPNYDFRSYQRSTPFNSPTEELQDLINSNKTPQHNEISHPDVVFIEGILMLYRKKIRDLVDIKLFVDLDSDVRLSRQVVRDTEERYHLSLETVLLHYINFVKPAFEDFILPTKKFADVIIPRGESNIVAIDLIAQHATEALSKTLSQPL